MTISSAANAVPSAANGLKTDTPVFLTGFARSGTTWVNKLFRDYFDAGFVNEGQFIVSFGLRLARYGDLQRRDNRQRLVRDLSTDDFFSILKRNYQVEIDWQRVMAVPPTFAAMVLDILRQIADQMGKTRIGSKYPVFGRYLGLLNQHFPDCRVVHVIRDGRDCALSHKHMGWGHQNAYAAAVHWRDYLRKASSDARDMSSRYLEIRYEDLLAKPGSSMAALEEFVTGMPAGPVTERFMNDTKLLRPEKIAHWRQAMPQRSQAIFETVAGDALSEWSYPLTGLKCNITVLTKAGYIAHDRLSRETWYWANRMRIWTRRPNHGHDHDR